MTSYSEKLRHPSWQRRRLEILGSRGFECERCSNTECTLHVHHKFYIPRADPWDYPDDALVVLCEDCHRVESQAMALYEQLFRRFLSEGGSLGQLIGYLKGAVRPPIKPEDGEELIGIAQSMTVLGMEYEGLFLDSLKIRRVDIEIRKEWYPA